MSRIALAGLLFAVAASGFDTTQIAGNSQLGSSFSADQPGGPAESLYVALIQDLRLARIDTNSLKVTRVAPIPQSMELTGTAAADLWGFLPGQPSTISRIDKRTGALDSTYNLPQIQSVNTGS